ncbi:response regulator transcription factor [Lacrimispora brassicae]
MMNILVVDDEPLIHISIERLIQSGTEDTAVFHASNGREMLERLSEHDFALAYVDIKMPGISGLEALRQAREISPFTSYYIMTGFDEFEYAKQAIKLKVDDYLMKPLDTKTIQETIDAARKQQQKHMEQKKSMFRNWLESTLNHRDSSFGEYAGTYCGLLLVTVDMTGIPAEDVYIPFRSYENNIVSIFTENGLLLLCFSEKSDLIHGMFKTFSVCSYPQGVTCFASSITREPEDLKAALPILVKYSSLRVLLGLNHFYYLNPLQNYSSALLDFCQISMEVRTAYAAKDYTKFSTACSLLLNQYRLQEDFKKYQGAFITYLSLLFDRTLDTGPDADTSLETLFELAGKDLLNAPSIESKAQSIVRFIQEHYQDNISAADLASRFGLSANYISNLLKNALGIRYNDYVTQLRLNHGKELLVSTHMPIKEVTAACGYYSQSHFTRLFVDHEGCTPLEYRKNNASC